MTIKAILGGLVGALQGQVWRDPETQKLVDVVTAFASDESPINLSSPIQFINQTAQPAIMISGYGDSRGLQVTTPGGQTMSVGVGAGSEGIIANEFIPRPEYMLCPDGTNKQYSLNGGKAGSYTTTPGQLPTQQRPNNYPPFSGQGYIPNNTPGTVNGFTNQASSGPGRGTGYRVKGAALPFIEQEVATGDGAGSGGSSAASGVKWGGAGQGGGCGRATGSGRPGATHTGMQALTGWGEVLGYGQHGTSGFEVTVGNTRYMWPTVGGGGGGVTENLEVVTSVECSGGSLTVTTETMQFTNGLYQGVA